MKKNIMVMFAGLVLLTAGCATQSPCVGTWTGEHIQGEEIILEVKEEGRFLITTDGVGTGAWTPLGDGQFKLVITGDEGYQLIGAMITDDELVLTADGESVKLSRQ